MFALPTGADYIRLEQEYIALLYCDAREVKLIDYAGQEALTLALPGERVPLYIEVLTGREGIYLLARTQATDGENAMDAPYLLCRYSRSGALQWEMLLLESELGFYLYGDKCADAQDGLVIVGADKTDYKKAHILRIDAAGERTFHHVVSEKQGAVVSLERVVPDGEDTLLVGTAMAQSRGVFTCVTLRVDSAGGVTGQEIREFTQTSNYLYGVTAAPDGTAYAVKSEQKDKSTEYAWLSVVPLTDLPATDRAQLAIE